MSTAFDFHELKSTSRLPSPSGTALRIMQMVQNENIDIQKLAETVKTDPALTSRILSFANSAAFGARRPVASVFDAVKMMGMHAVRNFALSLSLVGNHQSGRCAGFDYSAYWMRSLAMAVAIATIVVRERTVSPEEAFTLGLLSEIGQLALATAWPEAFSECLRTTQGDGLLKMEYDRFAVNHNELTLLLMKDWGLPDIFLNALKLSLGPRQAEVNRTARFAGQLAFARQLADYCIVNDQSRGVLFPHLRHEAELHHIEGEALDQFIADCIQQWHDWGTQIHIKTDERLPLPKPAPEPTEELLPGLDILLVDNDHLGLAKLSKQLVTAGHRVDCCSDGESALKYVIEYKPQLLITDWRMKPMDGLSLCKTLRSSALGKKLYIILLTAAETEDEAVEAFDAGIDDYVTKPVNLRILLARIRAGQRIASLQQEVEKEKLDIQRYNAELAVANRRLSIIANTDILTGLPNRRYALSRLDQEWKGAQRYHRPISVLMLDIDHFKSVNDTLGHEAGDMVLTHIANLMKKTARTTDVVCRFGGEEFLVIATNTDGNTALLLAERIRQAIESHQPDLALTRPITISIGIAGSSEGVSDWKELIRMADNALYKVKVRSRNASLLTT